MNPPTKRVAIYTRVSTRDQEPENQLRTLRAYARDRRFKISAELEDRASGSRDDRPGLLEVMNLARKRKVDVVLVWKFDRFARSTKQLVDALAEFGDLGVDFISYTENVDTSTPAGKVLFTMVSAFAEFELDLIRERIHAGLDRARADGVKLGRPGLSAATIKEIKLLRRRYGVRETARRLRVSPGVVSKHAPAKKK